MNGCECTDIEMLLFCCPDIVPWGTEFSRISGIEILFTHGALFEPLLLFPFEFFLERVMYGSVDMTFLAFVLSVFFSSSLPPTK